MRWRGPQWSACVRAGLRGCIRPPLGCWTVQFPRRNTWPCTHHAPSHCAMVVGREKNLEDLTLHRKTYLYIPPLGIARPQSQFPHSCFCERFIYSAGSVRIFSCSRIGRSMVGIYKSLTDTCMWKLGLWLRNSFFGNIFFEFSVLVLCDVVAILVVYM